MLSEVIVPESMRGIGDSEHISVLTQELLDAVRTDKPVAILDCTAGAGGHGTAFFTSLSVCRYVGLDWDKEALDLARKALEPYGDKVTLLRENFSNAGELFKDERFSIILFDLGVSTMQLLRPYRGFSIKNDGPLDMRMDERTDVSAYDIVNKASVRDIERIIRDYGQERFAGRISRAIVRSRSIETTGELARIVASAIPGQAHKKHIHPATQVFQALRIAVNDEFGNLWAGLEGAAALLSDEGKLIVISFHSLEDRIVKQFFNRMAKQKNGFEVLTKKPVQAGSGEVRLNPRARSARMRVLVKRKVV